MAHITEKRTNLDLTTRYNLIQYNTNNTINTNIQMHIGRFYTDKDQGVNLYYLTCYIILNIKEAIVISKIGKCENKGLPT